MLGLAMGILPWLISLLLGNVPLLLFGTLFTLAAMGDLMIIHLIYQEDRQSYVLDHPSEAGCYVYRSLGNSGKG